MPSLAFAALSLLFAAQVPKEPAKDLFMRSAKVPGVELRFVDYHWQPAIMEAMATGKGSVAEAKRNWVVARIILDVRPLTLEGKRLPVGNYGLALWPNLDGQGMSYEMRRVDMRDVFPNLDAMAPVPRGETIYRGPARFEPLSPLSERLEVTMTEGQGTVLLTLRYGDRALPLTLTR